MTAYEWILGFGLTFGLGLALSLLIDFSIENFFGFATMINIYTVWMELLPLWTLIILILVLIFISMSEVKNRGL